MTTKKMRGSRIKTLMIMKFRKLQPQMLHQEIDILRLQVHLQFLGVELQTAGENRYFITGHWRYKRKSVPINISNF